MRRLLLITLSLMLMGGIFVSRAMAQEKDELGKKINSYFEELFDRLKMAADQDPAAETFREAMKPVAENTDGFYGATLIDPDFVIRQVYYPSHFLARGFNLKNVKELKDFYRMMREDPAPQLSEPAHGSIFQPRLIAMRYPVIKDGGLKNIISMMIRTKSFLQATDLDKYKAFKIICLGKLAEEKGKLSKDYKEVILRLPSTEWVIQYDK